MTDAEATGSLMQLMALAIRASSGIARYDSRLYAVYYSKSGQVSYFIGQRRVSRKAARQYLASSDAMATAAPTIAGASA